jgi:hypothetical protein
MARRNTIADLQAALTPTMPAGRERDRIAQALHARAQQRITAGAWATILELRAWAWQHPLFARSNAPLRGLLRRWEQALLSGAPLPTAAALVRDTLPCSPWDACDRLAARAEWSELRPLLADDRSAWCVAEGRVLHGESLAGRSPFSGMPLQRLAWEPTPNLPSYRVDGMGWSGTAIQAALAPLALPAPRARLELLHEWGDLLAAWHGWDTQVVAVEGGPLDAISTVLHCADGDDDDDRVPAPTQLGVGRCTLGEAVAAMQHMHGMPAPYMEGRGMVAARRVVWRLLAALTDTAWPPEPAQLSAAIEQLEWSHYDPQIDGAEPDWSLFLAVEAPARGRAWATHAWVSD